MSDTNITVTLMEAFKAATKDPKTFFRTVTMGVIGAVVSLVATAFLAALNAGDFIVAGEILLTTLVSCAIVGIIGFTLEKYVPGKLSGIIKWMFSNETSETQPNGPPDGPIVPQLPFGVSTLTDSEGKAVELDYKLWSQTYPGRITIASTLPAGALPVYLKGSGSKTALLLYSVDSNWLYATPQCVLFQTPPKTMIDMYNEMWTAPSPVKYMLDHFNRLDVKLVMALGPINGLAMQSEYNAGDVEAKRYVNDYLNGVMVNAQNAPYDVQRGYARDAFAACLDFVV